MARSASIRLRPAVAPALAAALLGAAILTLTACGDEDRTPAVQERQVGGEDKIGDAGLAPEEQSGGAGDARGKGEQAG